MGSRRTAQEATIQILYASELLGGGDEALARSFLDHFAVPASSREFAMHLYAGVMHRREAIDRALTCSSLRWPLSRMARVDLAILRTAAFEILFELETPLGAAIDEAIELAKRYGTDHSPAFVDGVAAKNSRVRKTCPATRVDRGSTSRRPEAEPFRDLQPPGTAGPIPSPPRSGPPCLR